jgi:CAAX protease family protein
MDAADTRSTRARLPARIRAWAAVHPVGVYLVMAYALSWAYWIPLVLAGKSVEPGVGWPSQMPGLAGPAIAAVIVTALVGGKAGLGELWQRLTRWRIGWWWLSVVAVVAAGAIGLAIVGHVETGELTLFNGIGATIGPLATVAVVFVLNGLGEEVGWRGFMADDLLKRHGLVATALLVAVVWSVWHAPMFFLVASMRSLSVGELVGWVLGLTSGSLLLTWLYRGSGSSILLVATWHTLFNFTSGATPAGSGAVAAITSTLVMVAAVAIVAADWWRGRSRRQPGSSGPIAPTPHQKAGA